MAHSRLRSKDKKADLAVQRCHTGLLGLGAVVRAYPYDVPHFVPELLMILSDHIHDPQPIQVRKQITNTPLPMQPRAMKTRH